MTDSDILDYIHVLKGWKDDKGDHRIKDILQRCQKVSKQVEETDLNNLVDSLTAFHKAINKSESVDQVWFKEVQSAKKHIRKLLDDKKKEQLLKKQPKLIKSSSEIQFPESACSEQDCKRKKQFLKLLYKNFLLHLEEGIQSKNKEIIKFLQEVVDAIAEDTGYNFDSMANSQENAREMLAKANRVAEELAKHDSSSGKLEMIEGKKSAKGVAKLEEEAYVGEELRRLRAQKLKAIATENQTGYYDQMKKNINKDAKEQCRFCKKMAAYCEDMKQIRASDEPMTRFMYCNNCNKRWRQE